MSFAELLAFERLPADTGSAVLRAQVGPEHVNMHGSAHGGFLYSLADEAFAIASNSREADAVALSVHMDYFRAVFPGDRLVATAREEHLGRSVATYRVEVVRWPAEAGDARAPAAGGGVAGGGAPGAAAARGSAAGGAPSAAPGEDAEEPGGEPVALFTGTVYRRARREEPA